MLLSVGSSAHGVLVGYQLGTFPGGNNVRVWIEHWHGAATNVSGFPLQWRINTSSGVGTTYTTYATGYVNGQDSTTLQSNQSDIIFLPGACTQANAYGNWVYWDFNISVCSTNPTQLEIIAGTAATTAEGCASLYPQTIGGVNAPTITASNLTYNQCPPVTLNPSTLSNYIVTSLCDANPKVVLGYGNSTWEVGTTPIPTWTINGNSQITITATDNNTLQTSTGGFQVNFVDNTSPTVVTQDVYVTLDAQGQATITTADVDNGSSDNCSNNLSMSLSQTTFTCADGASKQVTLTVDDNNGNTATGTATVHITNSATPTIDIANSLCGSQGLYWATWNSLNSTSGSGTFGNLGVTVSVTHSAGGLSTTSTMYNHSTFPSQYNVPNTTSLRNDSAGTFTFCFSQPVTNPQIAFSSIGNPSTPVGISSSVPYQVIWSGTGVAYNSTTSFTGTEGFNIVSFPGTHQCITLTYAANETYANLAFGFENFNCTDPTICAGDQVTLTASGANSYVWTPSTGLSATNTASVVASPTATTTYSVSDPTLPCSSPQTVTIKVPNPTAPVASSPQTNCYGATLADLVATVPTGMSLDWYAASSGGTVLPLTTQLVDGTTYYAETTDITCGSSTTRTPVVASVIPQFSAPADVTVNTDPSSCVATNVALGGPTQSVACYSLTNNAPTSYPIGATTVTWTATYVDGTVLTSDQTVNVIDINIPWVSLQSSTTVNSNSSAALLDANATSGATQNINGATIVISDNFQSGDVLSFASALPSGVSSSYNSGSGVMTITGTMTPTQFESVLQSIQFSTTSNVNNADRTVSITAGSAIANTNGHYYEYVPGSLSWTAAKTAASQRTLNGLQGYLATVTSASENDFIEAKVAANAWMGGSDDYAQINAAKGFTAYANQSAAEGNWHWITGPEAGQVISYGNSPSVTIPSGSYAKWQNGEPNDYPNASTVGEENYLHIYSSSQGKWNDFPNTVGGGLGYVVEYGGLSTDPSCLVFSDEITVVVNTLPQVTTNSAPTSVAHASAVIGGNVTNIGGSAVTDRGIVFATTATPTILDSKAAATTPTGAGSFSSNLSGLSSSTLYYARAYATNTSGTAYGSVISFYTAPIDIVSITSTDYDATSGYDVICFGNSTTLTATSPEGVVQWYDDASFNNLIGTGNSITVSPTSTTTYYARNLNNGVYSVNATSLVVTVRPQPVAPVISGAETVCWNSQPNALTGVAATGGSSAAGTAPGFSYQWEESTDGGATWTSISGATNFASYQPGYLYQTTLYRLLATDQGSPSCFTSLASNSIEITVRDPFTPSVVSTNGTANTFCNAGTVVLNATATTGGSGPAYYYQWQESADSLNWTNVGSLLNNTTSLTVTGVTSDTHYRIIAFDQGTPACGSVFSINTVKAVIQTPVTEGSISGAQHICAQTAPTSAIVDVVSGTGRGAITYRWEESTDGGSTWNTITGATGASYQPGILNITTKYRRFAVSTLNGQVCESTLATNEVEITVDQLPIATMTTTTDVTCVDASYSLSGVTAQYGSITWTHDGTGTLANTNGVTPVYTPTANDAGNTVNITLTVTGTTICLSTTATASLALQVDSLPKATAGGMATICSNSTHTVVGASAKYGTIQWTHDGLGTLTNATTNTPTYAPVAGDAGNTVTLTMTVSSNNQCATATDIATYTIDVDPLPVATAGGSDIICSMSSATVTGATSGNGTILWTHNGSGTLSDATTIAPTYTAGASDAGSTVTLTMTVTSDNTCTPQVATATYAVTVRPDFIPATFANQDQDLCYLTSASQITATAASGGTGPYAYQWQVSNDNSTWTDVTGATSLTYTPSGILNATKYYRILSTDLGSPGCGTSLPGGSDVTILVRNPLTPPVVSNITLCNGTSTTIVPIGAQGGRGTFEYQWQQSANGTTGWANVGIQSLDSAYTTGVLTTGSTYYRVIARDQDVGSLQSCGSTFSSPMKVTIGATATAGAIAGDETTCTGTSTADITSTTDGTGSGTISYKWEESTDAGSTWSIVQGATGSTYNAGSLSQTTWFRRTTVATLNGAPCESAVSNTVVKTVDQLPVFTAAPTATTVNTDAGLATAGVSYTATATGPTAVTLSYAMTGATTLSGAGTGSGTAFGIGTTSVTITATTNCGSVSTSFDIIVIDNEDPVIAAGNDLNFATTTSTTGCSMPVTVTSPVATDNAPGVSVAYVLSGATTGSGTVITNETFNVGTTTITWTATDASGNTASDVQLVVVTDAVAPAIANTPSNMVLTADAGTCATNATWTAPVASDECGIATFVSDASSGDSFPVGITTVTYTATDVNGNVATTSFTITVVDAELPVIAGTPSDITLTSDANACGTTATWIAPTSSDNCGISSFTGSHTSGDFFPVGTTTVTYTATDVNGNTQSTSFNVVVADLNPVITGVPSDITQGNDAGSCNAVVTWTAPVVTDNCSGVVVTSTHASGDIFSVGTTTVTYSAVDVNGNTTTASFNVTVSDTEDPMFVSAPADITISSTATTCDAPATWAAPVVDDNCTALPTLTSTHSSGDVFPVGTTAVTYTVLDAAGNSQTHTFNVTVEDNTAPVIASTSDITVSVDANSCTSNNPGVMVPLASDNCDANVTVVGSRSDALNINDPYPTGTTVITWTAVDVAGNNATALTQNVTVIDTIAPYITSQLADTFYVDENSCVFYLEAWRDSLAYSDNCGGSPTITSSRPANLFLNKGSHVISYTLSDANGNSRTYNHHVEIVDTISPWLLNMPANVLAYAGASSCGTTVSWTPPTASDNCVGFVLTGSAQSGDYFSLGTTTVVYTLVDAVGLSIQDSFDITVVDTISPVINTKPATLVLNSSGSASLNLSDVLATTTTDNCGVSSVVLGTSSFTCSDLGANTVTITATDVNGNTSTATATVTVIDNSAPAVSTQNVTVYLDANGSASISVSDVHSSSTDNCGVSGTTISQSTFGCSDLGANSVTVSSTDASGNVGTATAIVTVIDTISPILVVPSSALVAYATSNSCGASVYFTGVSGSDNCSSPTLTYDYTSGATFNIGTTVVTATATDASGNAVSSTFNVTVIDTISPIIVGTPSTVTIVPDLNSCSSLVSWNTPSATDNCGATLSSSSVSGSSFTTGTHTVTFTATDASGNTTTSSLTFTVNDVVNPTITNLPNDTTLYAGMNTCDAAFTWPQIVGADNCSSVTVTTSVPSGTLFSTGQTVVNVTAVDASGNTATGQFTVTVLDTVAPTWVFVPSNITTGNCSASVVFTAPVASDNCSGVSISQIAGLPSGSTYPVGLTTNTFVATDASGNTDTVSFTVSINVSTVTYTPPVTSLCINDPAVDLTDPNYTLTFVGSGINGTMFNPAVAGIGVHNLQYNFTDSLGCIVSGTFAIVVNQAPLKPTIVRLSSVVLSVNNVYPSYQWYRNGVAIPGATSQTYTVTQAGEYSVRVSNGGCYEFSDTFALGMGIDDIEVGTYLVYPNPSQGKFQIVHGFIGEELQVTVVNMLGQAVYHNLENESAFSIDLSHLPQGSYILVMRGEQTEVHQPIKIQR